MADRYASYRELSARETAGQAFRVRVRDKRTKVAVMAPHGGKIEFLTSELADEVAADEYSFYAFEGLKRIGNRDLHLTSGRFDEPVALSLVERAEVVVAFHGQGCRSESFVMVGGRHERLRHALGKALEDAGFALKDPSDDLHGLLPANLCNRGRSGAGVQLELSHRLRVELRQDVRSRRRFVAAARRALETYESENA
jgi:phage replication-related protein YjqB (UPF0714/DUF867 family)